MLSQNKEIFNYANLIQYHSKGYTGKGVRVCILEDDTDHRKTVLASLKEACPDSEVIFATIVEGDIYSRISASGTNIVTCSHGALAKDYITIEESQKLIEQNIVLFCAAGNSGTKGVVGLAKYPNWLSVGAVTLAKGKPFVWDYSSEGEELDLAGFIPYIQGAYVYQPVGTSFASPFVAGMCACFFQCFKEKYGRLPVYNETHKLVTTSTIDLLEQGFDAKAGHGLFVMPDIEGIDRFGKEVEEVMQKTNVVIHHSATKDGLLKDYDAIKRHHMEVDGWSDIGYHWVVERVNGTLVAIPGRDENTRGAHCSEYLMNSVGIGICVVGDFSQSPPDEETYWFVAQLCKDIMSRHPIINIKGHCFYSSTQCPGAMFDINKLDRIVRGEEAMQEVSEWAKEAREWCMKQGVTDGTDPKGTVTREQLWTMIYRAFCPQSSK